MEQINVTYDDNGSTSIIYGDILKLELLSTPEYYEIRCISTSKSRRVRALEFIDFLFGEYGIESGDEREAYGKISKTILEMYVSEEKIKSPDEYFKSRMEEYFRDVEEITPDDEFMIKNMDIYVKKEVPWAFVKSLDVAGEGQCIRVKSIENVSGKVIVPSEDTYIMIGSRGEVYDITKDKFDKTYVKTDEKFDIYEAMTDFIPTAYIEETGECIAIDDIAHKCYPVKGNGIYVKQLKKRSKVFNRYNKDEYFLGREGDYLAIRVDDTQDMYIIKQDIFEDTYELKK